MIRSENLHVSLTNILSFTRRAQHLSMGIHIAAANFSHPCVLIKVKYRSMCTSAHLAFGQIYIKMLNKYNITVT